MDSHNLDKTILRPQSGRIKLVLNGLINGRGRSGLREVLLPGVGARRVDSLLVLMAEQTQALKEQIRVTSKAGLLPLFQSKSKQVKHGKI